MTNFCEQYYLLPTRCHLCELKKIHSLQKYLKSKFFPLCSQLYWKGLFTLIYVRRCNNLPICTIQRFQVLWISIWDLQQNLSDSNSVTVVQNTTECLTECLLQRLLYCVDSILSVLTLCRQTDPALVFQLPLMTQYLVMSIPSLIP